jgi:hypothetical protein
MAHRTFKDNAGRLWEVWSVLPSKVERRRAGPVAALPLEDRRVKAETRIRLSDSMIGGWLCFETSGEKRRLAPFPSTWVTLRDSELAALCELATPVPRLHS